MGHLIEDLDRVWLDVTFRFIRHVGVSKAAREYAIALWTEAMAMHGYGPAEVPDPSDMQSITDAAYGLYEQGKHIKRASFRAATLEEGEIEWPTT